jgi:chromosome segregation ATPase
MELELQGWKVKVALIAVVVMVVAVPLARASMSNKGRAEDWHRRAVVAEESVAGLRAVIAERSRALNQRTIQANQLAARLESNGSALQRTKANVGALTRRQSQLADRSARLEKERATLQARVSSLETVGAELDACARLVASGTAAAKKKTPAAKTAAAAQTSRCAKASESFAALGQSK